METLIKVKIIREVELNGNSFFMVYVNDTIAKAFKFKLGDTEDEESEKKKALALASLLEKEGRAGSLKEIIYETSTQLESQ